MALKDEINRETVKLKDMPFKKKVSYIWEYYKFHIIGVIAAIVFLCVFIRDLRINKRPVYLDVVILNSDIAYRDDNPMMDDYIRILTQKLGMTRKEIDDLVKGENHQHADYKTYKNTMMYKVECAIICFLRILRIPKFLFKKYILGAAV